MSEEEHEPCYPSPIPDAGYRFVDGLGYGFTAGLAGSSVLSFFGGLRRGGGLAGAAGTLATYVALWEASSTAMDLARPNKEDLWNGLAGAAVSWAALGARRGAAGAALAAVGLGLHFVDGQVETPLPQQRQPLHAPRPAAAPGLLGIIPQGPPIFVQEVYVGDQEM